ncbi:MAG: Dam family site-specific DNA-(adenine-N6)-methyltransferase, partial [Anaerolineae bacterium]|nr:Dam family site-specific DNA-(adenine-N6)-methyltransferase [Anaerolineae bacterium]
YHEPFVGGGALFFRLYRDGLIQRASISDLNAELIDTYIAIRDHVEEVIALLSSYPYQREFYYELRSRDPWKMDLPARAARMIYLNKTCYNGLYRVNRQGKFNVPFGRYKSPKYCDPDNLRAVSQALQGVEIICAPFETVLERAKPGDLVYFDPPYVPVSKTADFTAYQPDGFSLDDQIRLRDVCIELSERNVSVMVSNSDTDFVRTCYAAPYFTISEVQANRAINSNAKGRGKLTELIITNYPAKVIQLRLLESRAIVAPTYTAGNRDR